MLIGISGRAGSGKSYAASLLTEQRGFATVKFATPLKAMLRALGLTTAHLEGPLKEVPCGLLQGKTPRFAMQTLGTEWGREMMGKALWENLFIEQVEELKGYNVVCDDVRFFNEANTIRRLGGSVIQLRSKNTVRDHHISEHGILEYDFAIYNDFTSGFASEFFKVVDAL